MGWGMARKLVTCRVTDGAARVQARRDLRHGRTRRTRMKIEHGGAVGTNHVLIEHLSAFLAEA